MAAQEKERKLKLGIVGIGVGASEILPAMEQMPEFELVAAADVNPRVLETFRQRYGAKTYREVTYRSRNARNWLVIQLPVGYVDIYTHAQRLQQYRREECSIQDRAAAVVVGRVDFNYETTVLWQDIGDGRRLIATAKARTREDLQLLRGTLFTMRFPGSSD